MFKYILVPATGAETDAPVFATALAIARLSGGHIVFLHVRPDVQAIVATMAATDLGGGTGYDQIIASLEGELADRQRKAETQFHEFCEREKIVISSEASGGPPSAEWKIETGDEATHLAEHGRISDLIVVGRAREGEAVALDVLEASLMQTGRPVLIVPDTPRNRTSGTVVIAWKNTRESARAVAAAQPFLETAGRVIILSIEEDTEVDEQHCERLRQALLWHNPNTTVQSLKQNSRSDADILLDAAGAADADLLVMGGYGHTRMREFVFGGFTRRVLAGADVPVFITH